jgi:ComF family protein
MYQHLLKKTKELLLDIFFPPLCLVCHTSLPEASREERLCAGCLESITVKTTLTCPLCGARLAENKKTCHENARYRLAAASSYENETVKHLVWQLKYQHQTAAASALSSILKRYLASLKLDLQAYTLIPLPLHPSRERTRGFNQSALIATHLGKTSGLPVEHRALVRVKNTPPQAETKDFKERITNIAGSFAVERPELVAGKNIILLDDVFTSGATIGEAVHTLKRAGARRIIALVVAKTG